MSIKQKVKSYFKTDKTSEVAAEVLQHFILPFAALWNVRASVDDAVMAFFAVDDRQTYEGTAKRGFKMPGEWQAAGSVFMKNAGNRDVPKGQRMWLVIDRKDQTAKVDIKLGGSFKTFRLTRPETEFLKDYVDVRKI